MRLFALCFLALCAGCAGAAPAGGNIACATDATSVPSSANTLAVEKPRPPDAAFDPLRHAVLPSRIRNRSSLKKPRAEFLTEVVHPRGRTVTGARSIHMPPIVLGTTAAGSILAIRKRRKA